MKSQNLQLPTKSFAVTPCTRPQLPCGNRVGLAGDLQPIKPMQTQLHLFLLPALIAGLNLIPAGRVSAQTFTVLHSFTGSSYLASPYAGLLLSGTTLYGTTSAGGGPSGGTVFALNTDGTGFTNLHHFTATADNGNGFYTNSDGANPVAGLILSGNTLYGTAADGGSSGVGTLFAVHTDGTGFTNLHSFAGYPSDGASPYAGLLLSGNILYGTALTGGSLDRGTLFAVHTDGTGFTNLHAFDTGNPWAGLVLSGKILYGTTAATVFAVNTDGSAFTNLHIFSTSRTNLSGVYTNTDGKEPRGELVLSGNTLYGTAQTGGSSGDGTVFKVNTDGTGFTTLHSFTANGPITVTNSDGANPVAGLILSGNTLYGTTFWGGSSYWGTVFALNTNGTDFATLHNFNFGDEGDSYAGLVLSGNTLYGTTSGNWIDFGMVFSLSFRPELTITPSGPNVILSWPTIVAGFDYSGYTLEATTNLVSPAFWAPVSPAPVVLNGQNTVTNPISGNRRFYRLTRSGYQTWATVADMPTGRDSLGAAADADGRIYAIGGQDGSGPRDTVEAYTPGTPGSWATKASMPTPRYGHAVIAGKDGRIYAIGGLALSGIMATLEVYTPSTDSWATKASMPTPRAWLGAAVSADGRIYAIGGMDNSGTPLATVEVYTPSSDSWATATSMPTARFSFAATAGAGGRIYAIGGAGAAGRLNTVEAFTPNAGAGTWATKASMPTARYALAAACRTDGRIYAVGGFNDVFNLATAEAYTPGTDSWITVPSLPTPRSYLAAAAGDDGRIYVIGGQDGPAAVGQKVEAYTP